MYPVKRPRPAPGFTLIEVVVVLVIIGIGMALGVPTMMRWYQSTQAQAAVEFYSSGLAMAKREAMSHNGVSRLSLSTNAKSGQFDWQVDLCYPTPDKPCNSSSGSWSTTTTPATNDPEKTAGYKSVKHSADALPGTAVMKIVLEPNGNDDIYFISSGWVDTGYPDRLERMRFSAKSGSEELMRPAALHIALAGTVTRCDPTVVAPDSRACP